MSDRCELRVTRDENTYQITCHEHGLIAMFSKAHMLDADIELRARNAWEQHVSEDKQLESALAHEKTVADGYHSGWQRAEKELEAVKAELAITRGRFKAANAEVETAHADVARVNREAAVMREALHRILHFPVHSEPVGGAYAMQDIAQDALSGSAGSDFLTREQVKPLVDALHHINTDDRYPHPLVIQALEHAAKLGLIP